jgi:hypothetical protein
MGIQRLRNTDLSGSHRWFTNVVKVSYTNEQLARFSISGKMFNKLCAPAFQGHVCINSLCLQCNVCYTQPFITQEKQKAIQIVLNTLNPNAQKNCNQTVKNARTPMHPKILVQRSWFETGFTYHWKVHIVSHLCPELQIYPHLNTQKLSCSTCTHKALSPATRKPIVILHYYYYQV